MIRKFSESIPDSSVAQGLSPGVPAQSSLLRWSWFAGLALALGCDVLPWSNFVGHAHWAKVVWIPFTEARLTAFDVVANILLFAPLGFLFMYPRRQCVRSALLRAGCIAAITAAAGEFFQVYCHNRFPSATDIANNVLGAELGAITALLCAWAHPAARRT